MYTSQISNSEIMPVLQVNYCARVMVTLVIDAFTKNNLE